MSTEGELEATAARGAVARSLNIVRPPLYWPWSAAIVALFPMLLVLVQAPEVAIVVGLTAITLGFLNNSKRRTSVNQPIKFGPSTLLRVIALIAVILALIAISFTTFERTHNWPVSAICSLGVFAAVLIGGPGIDRLWNKQPAAPSD